MNSLKYVIDCKIAILEKEIEELKSSFEPNGLLIIEKFNKIMKYNKIKLSGSKYEVHKITKN